MYEVYHAKEPNFGVGPELSFPAEYELVAVVEAENVEEAYYLTNSIDWGWWENEKVRMVKKSRSTSVGDVIINIATGKAERVEGCGWSTINKVNA